MINFRQISSTHKEMEGLTLDEAFEYLKNKELKGYKIERCIIKQNRPFALGIDNVGYVGDYFIYQILKDEEVKGMIEVFIEHLSKEKPTNLDVLWNIDLIP